MNGLRRGVPTVPDSRRSLGPAEQASRVAAGLVGGWAFAWGVTVLGIALLLAAGMPYEDARLLMSLIAFPVFVVALCAAVTAASVKSAWAVLVGSAVLATALARWLTA